MELTEKKLDGQTLYDGVIVRLERDRVELPDGGTSHREVVRHPGGVIVLPLDDKGRVRMVRQYRYPVGRVLTELPAGKLEYGEDPLAAAKRELSEEVGAAAEHWESLGRILPTPGYCDEVHHLWLATGLTFGEAHPDEGEFLEQLAIPFGLAVKMALDGSLTDSKSIVAILRADAKLK